MNPLFPHSHRDSPHWECGLWISELGIQCETVSLASRGTFGDHPELSLESANTSEIPALHYTCDFGNSAMAASASDPLSSFDNLNLHGKQSTAPSSIAIGTDYSTESAVVHSKLGAYAGLFHALRAKHPPTAAHSLRVALAASKWACFRGMSAESMEMLEVVALLHDVGKIGVPDSVLQKPAMLEQHEMLAMNMHWQVGIELLSNACASLDMLCLLSLCQPLQQDNKLAVENAAPEIQDGGAMLRILDAFDSMTNEQVFRRALSRERAVDELFTNAREQFRPDLVKEFAELIRHPRSDLEAMVAKRWLTCLNAGSQRLFFDLHAQRENERHGSQAADHVRTQEEGGQQEYEVNSIEGLLSGAVSSGAMQSLVNSVFHPLLADSITDGVIYVDISGQILHWNRAAESLTGFRAETLLNRTWAPDILNLQSKHDDPADEFRCPVQHVLQTGNRGSWPLRISDQKGNELSVQLTAIPAISNDKILAGVILVLRDTSTEAQLEQRVESLHEIATKDPLTGACNRSELNRRLPEFVSSHLEAGLPGSVIICDIDYFKRINDVHGHQAGDDALKTFAGILRERSRRDDLVVRYGGEEFVILCPNCDNPSATSLAEEIRRAVQKTPVPALKKQTMTSSFGVTQIQQGDDEETVLARADRALLSAKENGRNRVVQVGSGCGSEATMPVRSYSTEGQSNWLGWFRGNQKSMAVREYLTAVPQAVALQKLEGFIADHRAEVVSNQEGQITLRVDMRKAASAQRTSERGAVMMVHIAILPIEICVNGRNKSYQQQTKFTVTIRSVKSRDRRASALQGQACRFLASFQAYLVAREVDEELRQAIIEPR